MVLESLLFIVGRPLSHSLSPAMHNGVIARRGLPIRYVPMEIGPAALGEFLRVVRASNFLGGNVTIPFKEQAAALADERSDAVSFCGAANVLSVKSGRLKADNTDGDGFLDALSGAGWGSRFERVVILGAGGSARGISCALGASGTSEMTILNRTQARAGGIGEALSEKFPRMRVSTGGLTGGMMRKRFPGADLIVQCTSLGLTAEWPDFPLESIDRSTRFVDIVYRKGGTPLVRLLRRRRMKALDGLPMLAHQAALSFAIWTGIRVPAGEFLSLARIYMARGNKIMQNYV